MPHSFGRNARTRSKFARPFRGSGPLHLATYLRSFKQGDYVDIKTCGSIHRGMPHRYYHGKTGKVFNVTPRAVGVIVNKRVKHRIIAKRIHVRIEHVNPSKCQIAHKARVQSNDKITKAAKKTGVRKPLKRVPALPEKSHFVSLPASGVETFTPQRFVTLV